jgi:DnaJ-class molecular chaperone
MDDPYKILGLDRGVSEDEIRRSYRKLAKKLHPDLNPGDKQAEERFKEISQAYDLLSDPEKRARYDRGEIDAGGQERPDRSFYRGFAERGAGAKYRGGPSGEAEDLEDILAQAFGGSFGGRFRGGAFRARGADLHHVMTVDFLTAANGGKRRIRLGDGSIDLTIPPGTRDGQVLRLKGKGMPGTGGGPPGDALIEIRVAPHPFFRPVGDDIELDLPIVIKEAVLGARVQVPTITGPVYLTIPPNSSSGTRMRLRGKGLPTPDGRRGDQYAILRIVLAPEPEPELVEFMRKWEPRHPFDPRASMVS